MASAGPQLATARVVPATPADLDACAALMVATALWQRYGVTLDGGRRTLIAAADHGGHILVAWVGDEVAGFVLVYPRGGFARSGYVRLIGVAAAFQGQGIGDALMAAAESLVAGLAPDMFLLVSDFNIDAQRFYQRLGYVQVGALPAYVLSDVTELILWKKLHQHIEDG